MKTLLTTFARNITSGILLFTFLNSTTLKAQPGASLHFDGTNDFVSLPTNSSAWNLGGAFTVELWLKPGSVSSVQEILYAGHGCVACPMWAMSIGPEATCSNYGNAGRIQFMCMSTFVQSDVAPTVGVWTHVAVTYNGSVLRMFINGVQQSNAVQVTGTVGGSTYRYIGADPGCGLRYPYSGNMDELRIWNYARTQCQIMETKDAEITTTATGLTENYHFNHGTAGAANSIVTLTDASASGINGTLNNFGLSGGTSNWVTPGGVVSGNTTLSSPTATLAMTGNGNSITHGSSSSSISNHTDFGTVVTRTFVLQNTGTGTLYLNSPYFLTGTNAGEFSIVSPPAASLAASATTSLVVAFTPSTTGNKTAVITMNSSDCGTPNYSFVITATTTAAAALIFDGVNDYVETNANIAELAQADFAIEAWVKTTGISQAILTCANVNTTWETGEKCLYIDATGIPRFVGFGNGYIPGNIAVNNGNWHHIAVTWDYLSGTSGTGKMYIDGLDQTGTVSYAAFNVNVGTFKIGKQNYNNFTPEAPNNFTGLIDEVRVWNRALCLPEIINNMNCELPNPTSQSGLNGYYRFNSGLASGVNPTVTLAADNAVFANNGTLMNFALTGNTSNWTAPGGVITGSSCSVYLDSEINLMGNSTNIPDGDITPSLTDNTSFGAICINTLVTRTFSIQNLGTAPLTVSSMTMNGSGATSFSVGTLSPASPIAVGGSATFAVTFTATSGGVKTAALHITSSDCSEALYDVVLTGTINTLPVVTASTSNSVICNTFTTSVSGGGADTYTWTGTIPATNGVPFSPGATAVYTVTGTNTLTGCTNVAVQTITVNALPILAMSAVSNSICLGGTATLSATGANTYTWNPGPVNGATINPLPAITTTYSAFGTNTLTGCTSTNVVAQTITVNALPSVTAATPNASICAGTQATLTASGANSYTWNPGPISGSTVNPVVSTTTTYTLSGTSLAGCTSTNLSVQIISVNPNPTVSLVVTNASVCAGSSPTLTASNADTYTWSPGNFTTAVISPTPASTTVYTLTGSSSAGCLSSNTPTQMITVNNLPTLLGSTSNTFICAGETVTLSVSGANSYSWNTGENSSAIVVSTLTTITDFTVTGTDLNGCSNSIVITQGVSACTGIDQATNENLQLVIYPNPNNGTFIVETTVETDITILNAVGQIVLIQHVTEGKNKIDLSGNAMGMYFVKSSTGYFKIIKE